MNRLERAAILTELADELREHGSWTGETHLQKATYVLEELLGVNLELEFILYKHGPFSFDLRDELVSMRADGLIDQVAQAPYGPTLKPSASSKSLRQRMETFLGQFRPKIEFVASSLGSKGVFQLEQLTTALFVHRRQGVGSNDEIAAEVQRLKPHISSEQASATVAELRALLDGAAKIRRPRGAQIQ